MNKGSCLPVHLSELYEKSSTELDENQRVQLKLLLIEYADVFSSYDFDLGNQHAIDTCDARPIKHKFRRTPTAFKGEEEKHL